MEIRPGEIYWVDIPQEHTAGSEQFKRRPFVIVSRLRVNRSGRVVTGVPLTTTGAVPGEHPPYRIFIPASEISRDVGFSGNVLDSIALVDQVRVLGKVRLEQKMGVVSDTAFTAIGLGLGYLFDLR